MLCNQYRKRSIAFFWVIVCLFAFVFCRLSYLQLWQGKQMRKLASHKGSITLEMKRGIIYDRQGRELAVSVEVESLYAHPKLVKTPYRAARKLSPILNLPAEVILKQLKKRDTPFVWIARRLTKVKADQIRRLKLTGFNFIGEQKRFYPKKTSAAHLIGFVGLDNRGLEGIELQFDHCLRGPTKKIELIRDAEGKIILEGKDETSIKPSGYELILTIDEVIQHAAEIELEAACEQYQAASGAVIVMNPKTGEIMALAVRPAYNPNNFWDYDSACWRNRAITDIYEPGSTFKIFTATYLLEKKLVTPQSRFYCQGRIRVGNRVIRCHEDHGHLDFSGVIANSCNVGTILASKELKSAQFYSLLLDFGFSKLSQIDLPGEEKGLLRKPKEWTELSKATMVIGQGVSVTPMQLITAVSAIANKGMLMRPLIVKAIRSPEGKIIKEYHPIKVKQVIDRELAKEVTEVLKGVVTQGTGELAMIEGYDIAGKTGTAQKVDPVEKGYSSSKYISSFIGYLPADDPQLVVLAIVDEPKGTHWGSKVAAPVFARVVKRIVPYLYILPQFGTKSVRMKG